MARITFKAKVHNVRNADGSIDYRVVDVPTLTTRHCDMPAFRSHPRYGMIANSTLFPNALARIKRDHTRSNGSIRLDQLPDNASVDLSGFLACVTIYV